MKPSTPIHYILIFLIFSGLSFVSACRRPDKINIRTNTINVPLSSDISSLDPANAYDLVSGHVIYQIYETLYEYHYLKRPYTLIPLLAESMPIIQNQGKRYIIQIKKNIRYHDNPCFEGKPRHVKAQDFINQIKRLAYTSTGSNGWWLFDGKIVGINKFREQVGSDYSRFLSTNIQGLEAPDDHTLIINLLTPIPQFQFFLAMSHTSPIPEEAIKYYQNNLNEQDVGTGPFKLKSWKRGHGIQLSRFEDYRDSFYPSGGDRISNDKNLLKDAGKKIPFIDNIQFHFIKEGQTRWLNFLAKNIDFIDNIPKDSFESVLTPSGTLNKELVAKKIKMEMTSTLTYWWLSFNMKDTLLGSNKLLRFAIAHAIDIDRYIRTFTHNMGLKANSIYPPGIPGYDPTRQPPYAYDQEKAKRLLEMAGYPGGKGLPEITFDTRGNDTTQRQQAEFIKSELGKIGIKINIALNTFPGFLNKTRNGNLQFWLGGWAMDYPDSENVLQLLHTQNFPPGTNANSYSNKKFDELFEVLKTKENGQEKFELMKQMEDLVFDDLPWVMLYYSRNYILYYDHIKNFRHSDLVFNYLKFVKKARN